MFKSIVDDVKNSFRSGNMITILILINCIVFLGVLLLKLIFFKWQADVGTDGYLYTFIVDENLRLSSKWLEALKHPWTLFTHMFLHTGPWHLVINMLWLYWFGRILGDLLGDKRVLPIYIMGGLFGGIVYLITSSIIPWSGGPGALGASAAVMAIVMAAAVTSPDYQMRLIFLGDVKLKYVALVVIVLDLLGTMAGNSGGHFGHLGGLLFGYSYVVGLRNGYNLGSPVDYVTDLYNGNRDIKKSKPKAKMEVAHRSKLVKPSRKEPTTNSTNQERLDQILDKIKQKGFDNLSDEEKEFLYQASKKK